MFFVGWVDDSFYFVSTAAVHKPVEDTSYFTICYFPTGFGHCDKIEIATSFCGGEGGREGGFLQQLSSVQFSSIQTQNVAFGSALFVGGTSHLAT